MKVTRTEIPDVLVIELGPHAVDLIAHHAPAVIAVVLLLAITGFTIWWFRRKRSGKPMLE